MRSFDHSGLSWMVIECICVILMYRIFWALGRKLWWTVWRSLKSVCPWAYTVFAMWTTVCLNFQNILDWTKLLCHETVVRNTHRNQCRHTADSGSGLLCENPVNNEDIMLWYFCENYSTSLRYKTKCANTGKSIHLFKKVKTKLTQSSIICVRWTNLCSCTPDTDLQYS